MIRVILSDSEASLHEILRKVSAQNDRNKKFLFNLAYPKSVFLIYALYHRGKWFSLS